MSSPLLVAMPALNEGSNLGAVIGSIQSTLGKDAQILVVDDGSDDSTAAIAEQAGARVIRHEQTLGLGQSFRDILLFALRHNVSLLVTIDADGQFDPAEIPRLVAPIRDGRADFVAGQRFGDRRAHRPPNMSRIKFYGNLAMNRIVSRVTGREICDASCGFRAYSREALLRLNLHSSFTYTQETFIDLATKHIRIQQVPISVEYRRERKSRVVRNVFHYALRTLATILRTVRDHRPLLIFGAPACLLCVAGISAGIFMLGHYLGTGSFSPYIFVGMTGAYLFSIGLIVGIVGIASDMLRPIRRNQEEMLYLLKSQHYYGNSRQPGTGD